MRNVAWLLALGTACGGCENKPAATDQRLVWGRERLAAELQEKAKEPIDAFALADRPELKNRVLQMRFDEVVSRLGFLEYRGRASFNLRASLNGIEIVEDTTIEHGLHGTYRIIQKDADGAITREMIHNNGLNYLRNGPGKMRLEGYADQSHRDQPEEAWQPLRVFTSYYGPRVGLAPKGTETVAGRSAVRYEFLLLEGSPLISVPGMKGQKKPVSLSGELFVDEQTGVPLKGNLRGKLEIPSTENKAPGSLELEHKFSLKTVAGTEIKPDAFEPTIERHPVDLDPLAFLDGGTRTSTIIGGRRAPTE